MLITMVSCDKQLEEVPYSSLSSGNVFSNEDGLKKASLGVYHSWTAHDFFGPYFRFALTEAGHRYSTGGMFGAAYLDPYYRFGHTPGDGGGHISWNRLYNIIARANSVIDNADKAVSDATKAAVYKAEARMNRAYAYFYLVRFFGGVPLIDKEITSLGQTDLIYGTNASISEVYALIEADLLFAESNLPDQWTGQDKGRMTAGAAKALLGKVYLTMAGKPLQSAGHYDKAVTKLQEVVGGANETKYGFGLVPDFTEVFSTSNERNEEVIMSFSYFFSSASPNASILPFFQFPRGLVNGDEQTNYGLTYAFYELFEPEDVRRDFTVVERYEFTGNPIDGAISGDSIIYDQVARNYKIKRTGQIFGNAQLKSGLAFAKYDRVPRPSGTHPWAYGSDIIELRFADVLLCLAEALIETGKAGDALPLINRVRQRAQATPYAGLPADPRAALRLERRLELTGEFNTVHDIRRWGTLQEEIANMAADQVVGGLGTYSPKLELYPIPQPQIDANPNLKQNTGW